MSLGRCLALALGGVILIGSPATAVPITKLHGEFAESKSNTKGGAAPLRGLRRGSPLPTPSPAGNACTNSPASAGAVQVTPRKRVRGPSVEAATEGSTGSGMRTRARRVGTPPAPIGTLFVTPCLPPPFNVGDLNPWLDPIEPEPLDVLVEEFTDPHQPTLFDFPIEGVNASGGLPPDFSFSDSTSITVDREDLASVPEPATSAMLGGGLLAIIWIRRRRKQNRGPSQAI